MTSTGIIGFLLFSLNVLTSAQDMMMGNGGGIVNGGFNVAMGIKSEFEMSFDANAGGEEQSICK